MAFKILSCFFVVTLLFSCATISQTAGTDSSVYFHASENTDESLIELHQFIETEKYTSARNLIESIDDSSNTDLIYLSAWNNFRLKQYATAIGLFQKLTTMETNNRGFWGIAFVHQDRGYYKAAADQALAGLYFESETSSVPKGALYLIAGQSFYMLEEWDKYDEFVKLALDSGFGTKDDRAQYAEWLKKERREQDAALYE